MPNLSHKESYRDACVPSLNMQQGAHNPPPITREGYFEKLRKLEEYPASSSTSRGGKNRGGFRGLKKRWTGFSFYSGQSQRLNWDPKTLLFDL